MFLYVLKDFKALRLSEKEKRFEMAAYAALLSLMHTIHHIKIHPRPPISLDQKQVESLMDNVTLLQKFLECYSSEENDELESRIAAAAYAAEDVIESHIVDQIHARSKISNVDLCQCLRGVMDLIKNEVMKIMGSQVEDPINAGLYGGLERVIVDMDLIKKEVMEAMIKEKIMRSQHHHLHSNSSVSAASVRPASKGRNSTMARFDDVLINEILDKLSGQQRHLQIIPIVGMGGIEDDEILVSDLIELWIAEGIVRPIDDKRLEEVAEEYVKELIDKNLILIHELSWNGEAEICKMHDLLRDLCLREAQKQRFLCVLRQTELDIPLGVNMERHICIHDNTTEECCSQFNLATKSMPLTRSFVYKRRTYVGETAASPTLCLGLLRVYSVVGKYNSLVTYSDNTIFQQANLRYLCLYFRFDALSRFNALCFLLWNIQTLKVVIPFSFEPIIAPAEIWGMPSLRHAILNGFQLPDPPCGMDNFVLENLQNLSGIINFKCSEEVVRRIPNIKTLKFKCRRFDDEELPDLCLNNLGRLQKLESVHLYVEISHEELVGSHLVQNITFPLSLKKLTLYGTMLKWEDLTTKVGSLPFLEFLKLDLFSCKGPVWETLEGQFCSLMFLQIDDMSYMRYWITDGTHFPRLEHIVLRNLEELEEIPSSIGDIPTLKSIQLICCSQSAADSVEIIKEEQEDNGNEELQVLISKI
ncbi:hypothetical protein ACS0TY_017218 [Phlomoides rotata]